MQQKQCPRCGAILHENQRIHWQCVAIRTRQKLGIPIGGAVTVLLVVVGIGLFTSTRGTPPEVILPTQMSLPTTAPVTATRVPVQSSVTPTRKVSPTRVTPTKVLAARATGTKAAQTAATAATPTSRASRSTPVSTATAMPDSGSASGITGAVYSTTRVNLRTGPGRNFESVIILSPGSTLTMIGRTQNNNWLKVQTEAEEEGWIIANLVKLDEQNGKVPSISSLPVVPDS